jgi:hypothetical protein
MVRLWAIGATLALIGFFEQQTARPDQAVRHRTVLFWRSFAMKTLFSLAVLVGVFALTGADDAKAAGQCRCCAPTAVAPAPADAAAAAQAPQVRRYSYEPMVPARSYYPARSYSSRTPSYLLPKSDPRKFGGF